MRYDSLTDDSAPLASLADAAFGARVTVLGPCPGCDGWQIDYSNDVASTYMVSYFDRATGEVQVISDLWYAVVEAAIAEHLLECPHLAEIVAELNP